MLDRLLLLHMSMTVKHWDMINCVLKYADDFSPLVPENSDVSAARWHTLFNGMRE